MKSLTKTLLILVLSYSCLFAQENSNTNQNEDEFKTRGWDNGKMWESMAYQEKIIYLNGIETGWVLAKQYIGNSPEFEKLLITGFRPSDLVDEIDLFYKERANIRIAIGYVYSYVIRKMKGATATELDDYIVWLRKTFNN